jgi:hypothetical protein
MRIRDVAVPVGSSAVVGSDLWMLFAGEERGGSGSGATLAANGDSGEEIFS